MKEIAPNIYVEAGYYGVTVGALITGDGVVCIDSPALPADARDWRSRLARLTSQPIRHIVYTDAHRERILGGQYLCGAAIAHDLAGETLRGYGDALRQQAADMLSRRAPEAAAEIMANLRVTTPHITFSRRLVVRRGSITLVLRHVGGATPGSLWALLPELDVMFAGDTVTHNVHPDLGEADLDRWIELLSELRGKKAPAALIVPGRGGPLARKSDLSRLSSYLQAVRARVEAMLKCPRADMAALAQEFLPHFPVPANEREYVLRRIKAGLEHVYDVGQKRKG